MRKAIQRSRLHFGKEPQDIADYGRKVLCVSRRNHDLDTLLDFNALHFRNFMPSGDTKFNPGNNEQAAQAVQTGSPAEVELDRRHDYLWEAVGRMVHDEDDKWWDGPGDQGAIVA